MCECERNLELDTKNSIVNDVLLYGPSVVFEHNLESTLKSTSASVCQMFLANICDSKSKSYLNKNQSTSWLVPRLSASDKNRSEKYLVEHKKQFFVHAPLSLNLAGDKKQAVAKCLSQQLNEISGLPAVCVAHIGKVGTINDTLETINLIDIPSSKYVNHQLLLECAAGGKSQCGSTWKEIRSLYEQLDTTKVGLCLDTAHLFASKMSTLMSHESIVRLFDKAEDITGLSPGLIHLNGSKHQYGSKIDAHNSLTDTDHIWSSDSDREGLASLLERCNTDRIAMICETGNYNFDLDIINSYGYDIQV